MAILTAYKTHRIGGFSMAEVMVGFILLSILSLFVSNAFSNLSQGKARINQDLAIANTSAILSRILSNVDSCKLALNGQTVDLIGPKSGVKINYPDSTVIEGQPFSDGINVQSTSISLAPIDVANSVYLASLTVNLAASGNLVRTPPAPKVFKVPVVIVIDPVTGATSIDDCALVSTDNLAPAFTGTSCAGGEMMVGLDGNFKAQCAPAPTTTVTVTTVTPFKHVVRFANVLSNFNHTPTIMMWKIDGNSVFMGGPWYDCGAGMKANIISTQYPNPYLQGKTAPIVKQGSKVTLSNAVNGANGVVDVTFSCDQKP